MGKAINAIKKSAALERNRIAVRRLLETIKEPDIASLAKSYGLDEAEIKHLIKEVKNG